MRLVSYLRVSTDGQVDGWGLDAQRAAVAKWADANGHDVVAEHRDEGVSGTLVERDGWADAEGMVRDGSVDGVVVYKLDRLARDMLVQEQLMGDVWRAGGEVFSTATDENNLRNDPDDPSRKMLRRIIGAVSEYEREMVVLRMRRGRRAKVAAGGKGSGSYPFGFTRLGPDDREQAVLAHVRVLREQGATWAQVAARLNAMGPQWRPRTAATWSYASIRKVAG